MTTTEKCVQIVKLIKDIDYDGIIASLLWNALEHQELYEKTLDTYAQKQVDKSHCYGEDCVDCFEYHWEKAQDEIEGVLDILQKELEKK